MCIGKFIFLVRNRSITKVFAVKKKKRKSMKAKTTIMEVDNYFSEELLNKRIWIVVLINSGTACLVASVVSDS